MKGKNYILFSYYVIVIFSLLCYLLFQLKTLPQKTRTTPPHQVYHQVNQEWKCKGESRPWRLNFGKQRNSRELFRKLKLKQESRTAQIFGKDQLNAMSRRAMNGVQWSPATVKKALQLRFSCGSAGYKVLLKQHFPLPSERTLQRRLQNISFQPGVLT